jgi:hypothetical protein
MKWNDGRFARHHTFRYIALNTLMRQQAFGHSRFYTSKHHRTALTKDELRQALEDPDRPEAPGNLESDISVCWCYQRNASLLVQEAA